MNAFVSIIFTLSHSFEEIFGKGGPIWFGLGNVVKVKVPHFLGFLVFNVFLSLALSVIAVVGYNFNSSLFLSILLGTRLGDALITHWFLYLTNLLKPNPGVYTTVLYFFEVVVLFLTIDINLVGLLGGFGFFLLPLPTLVLLKKICVKFHH